MSLSASKYDVIVVGGGPGGSAAAKRCAEHGLKVLLLEKRKRPRHKVCSGWLMGSFTQKIVDRVFGPVPLNVLNDPPHLSGFMIHAPGGKREIVEGKIPQAWRKDLDYWMNQKASEAGVEIWDESRVTSVTEDDEKCSVRLVRRGREHEISHRLRRVPVSCEEIPLPRLESTFYAGIGALVSRVARRPGKGISPRILVPGRRI